MQGELLLAVASDQIFCVLWSPRSVVVTPLWSPRPVLVKRAARALAEGLAVQALPLLAAVNVRIELLKAFDCQRKDLRHLLTRAGEACPHAPKQEMLPASRV